MIEISGCRAKDPSTCPYHGAAIRANEAEKQGDFEGYFLARSQMMEAEKKTNRGLKGILNPETIVPVPSPVMKQPTQGRTYLEDKLEAVRTGQPVPVSAGRTEEPSPKSETKTYLETKLDQEKKNKAKKHDRMFEDRANYLKNSAAVPTPMEAQALWLAVYEAQGGRVREPYDFDYNQKAIVFGDNNTMNGPEGERFDPSNIAYEDIAWKRWTPTRGGNPIPEGYGSGSLSLLVLPDAVDQNLSATRKNDNREGWEYGHTKVYILKRDKDAPYGFRAETNDWKPPTYRDIEAYRKGKSIPELIEALGKKSGSPLGAKSASELPK